MDYVDASGCPRNYGDGFVDASNCYRSWGSSFVDYDNKYRSFGEPFVDKSGFMRSFGEGFVDGDGTWREPRQSLRFLELIGEDTSTVCCSKSDSEQSYEPIDFSNITSDDVINGLSIFEKLFRCILILNGLCLSVGFEPIIFLILLITKKIKKNTASKSLKFAVVVSAFLTLEWICAAIYLLFFNREILEQLLSVITGLIEKIDLNNL